MKIQYLESSGSICRSVEITTLHNLRLDYLILCILYLISDQEWSRQWTLRNLLDYPQYPMWECLFFHLQRLCVISICIHVPLAEYGSSTNSERVAEGVFSKSISLSFSLLRWLSSPSEGDFFMTVDFDCFFFSSMLYSTQKPTPHNTSLVNTLLSREFVPIKTKCTSLGEFHQMPTRGSNFFLLMYYSRNRALFLRQRNEEQTLLSGCSWAFLAWE